MSEISTEALREEVLARLRVGVARLKLDMLDLEAVGVSVKHRCISAEQAVAILRERDALDWLFPDGLPDEEKGS